jgi:hypothetical protein
MAIIDTGATNSFNTIDFTHKKRLLTCSGSGTVWDMCRNIITTETEKFLAKIEVGGIASDTKLYGARNLTHKVVLGMDWKKRNIKRRELV